MLFNSLQFLFFFPIVAALYFILPHRIRWVLLLLASYYFYMSWVPSYAILILCTTFVTYLCAIAIGKMNNAMIKKLLVAACLVVVMGVLVLFKYYGFLAGSIREIAVHLGAPRPDIPALKILLPVGISFYTFQSAGYVIDVYRGRVKPENHFGIYALYVSFFPQLVAGPIERSFNLLPQFREKVDFEYRRVTDGLKLMAWGFFLKVVIADNLAVYVNAVYSKPSAHHGPALLVATYLFAFQIFCDFAGYTEIAIGAARILGFDLMENFERPYFAKSIPEFWRRWHISLSTWFRDYLYIPLGGNRVSLSRWSFNLFFVFLVCGLWHGAAWTFVAWGALHGLYMVVSVLTKRLRTRAEEGAGLDPGGPLVRFMKVMVTFHLVCFGWIFFRANSMSDALYIVSGLFAGWTEGLQEVVNPVRLMLYITLVAFLLGVHLVQRRVTVRDYIIRQPVHFRWAGYFALILGIFFFGRFEGSDFIYFQF